MTSFISAFEPDLIPQSVRVDELKQEGPQEKKITYAPLVKNYLQPLRSLNSLYLNKSGERGVDVATVKKSLRSMSEVRFELPPKYFVLTLIGT